MIEHIKDITYLWNNFLLNSIRNWSYMLQNNARSSVVCWKVSYDVMTLCAKVIDNISRHIISFKFYTISSSQIERFLFCMRIEILRLFRIMSIPIMFRLFRVLTSEMLGRLLPVFKLLLWQRQHIIVVDAVDYK